MEDERVRTQLGGRSIAYEARGIDLGLRRCPAVARSHQVKKCMLRLKADDLVVAKNINADAAALTTTAFSIGKS